MPKNSSHLRPLFTSFDLLRAQFQLLLIDLDSLPHSFSTFAPFLFAGIHFLEFPLQYDHTHFQSLILRLQDHIRLLHDDDPLKSYALQLLRALTDLSTFLRASSSSSRPASSRGGAASRRAASRPSRRGASRPSRCRKTRRFSSSLHH